MASPRALLFCCAPSMVDPLRAFQPHLWLCLGSAALGLCGAAGLKALRRCRQQASWSSHAVRRLRAAAIVLARRIWVQFWSTFHFWAFFCYLLEASLLLRNPTCHRSLAIYYLFCWGMPATHCLPGIQLLISPADARCSSPRPLVQVLEVLQYAATYVALTLVFLGSPVLFSRGLQAVPVLLRKGTGMYTARGLSQELQLRWRFFDILLVFFACCYFVDNGKKWTLEEQTLPLLVTLCLHMMATSHAESIEWVPTHAGILCQEKQLMCQEDYASQEIFK